MVSTWIAPSARPMAIRRARPSQRALRGVPAIIRVRVQPVRRLGELVARRPGNVHSADGWRNVLEPVVMRPRKGRCGCIFVPMPFASPDGIRISRPRDYSTSSASEANAILQRNTLARACRDPSVARPTIIRRFHASFSYPWAGSWNKKRRMSRCCQRGTPASWFLASVSSSLDLSRPTKRVVAFYNHRGTAEQHIKEGRTPSTGPICHVDKFRNNAVRLQLRRPGHIQSGQLHEDTGFAEGH